MMYEQTVFFYPNQIPDKVISSIIELSNSSGIKINYHAEHFKTIAGKETMVFPCLLVFGISELTIKEAVTKVSDLLIKNGGRIARVSIISKIFVC